MFEWEAKGFTGRSAELRKLDGLYNSDKFECIIVHGRQRTGKTALLREFIKGKDTVIYFAAQETSDRENLDAMVNAIDTFPREVMGEAKLKNYYDEAFDRLNKLSRTERVVFIIDDYQFLVAANRSISELICRHIEQKLSTGKLMLIISGSSEPIMESEVLGHNSPFHGHRTAQLRLEPFDFFEAKKHYSRFSPFDIAVIYGVTGGIPMYLNMMDPDLPVEENIKRAFFDPSSPMYEEPSNFLRREVRDPAYYNAVLKAIATGHTKNSDIATTVGLETSACTAYLKNLIAFGLVEKYTPVTEKAGKKTVYEIEDSMFRFWYRFVPDNVSMIQSGMADKIWRGVAKEIPSFMGQVFEDICRQWVAQRNIAGNLPVRFVEIGRWWGYDHVLKKETIIPIVAYTDDDYALFGDCVWSDEPTDAEALRSLEERSLLFRYPNRFLYLFSRSGFTNECAQLAQRIGAYLILFE